MANFTAGNLVVYRVGTGTGALSNAATAVFLDEYTVTGTLVQSIALPDTATATVNALTQSGTATSNGLLTLSADGRYLLLGGYDASVGTTGVTSSAATTVSRTIARVGADGIADTSTSLTDAFTGDNFRGVASLNGSSFYVSGTGGTGTNGVRLAEFGASTSTSIATTPITNIRAIDIFDGQVYVSASSGAIRIGTVGTGTPTTGGQTITNLLGYPTSGGSPYEFFFADLTTTVAGVDTLYVADDAAGLSKYSLVGGSWTLNGTIAGAIRGLAGATSGGTQVSLYATTATAAGVPQQIVSYLDTSGYNGALSGSSTVVATATANTALRGIAFAPQAANAGATLSVNDVTVAEGNAGSTLLTFTITSSVAASAGGIQVNFATADGTALAGSDYVATSGTASIAAGANSTTVSVTVNGDTDVEGNETLFLNLSSPVNATIADAQGVGTIQTDDTTIAISDVSIVEGDAGTRTLVFTVTASAPAPAGGISFTAATADGTATGGSDYVALSTTATIAAGATSTTVRVTLNSDTAIEGNETVLVNLSNATGAVIADGQGVGTIVNDDAGATVGGILINAASPSLQGASITPTATNAIALTRLGASTVLGAEGAESIAYESNGTSTRLYVTNARTGAERVDVFTVGADGTLTAAGSIALGGLVNYGNVNSVAVRGGVVAVAYNAAAGDQPGYVALFDATTLAARGAPIQVGVLPDQVTFSADGSRVLVANEAQNTATVSTPGSISIIDVATGAVTNTIDFAALNGSEAILRGRGLPILPGQLASTDIEPEYISVIGTKAYVTLQEVNAVAIVDLTTNSITAIQPLGGVDHSLAGNMFDPSDRDGAGSTAAINLVNAPVTSLLQPDAIATYTVGGVTYFVTANEGDARALAPNDADVGEVVRLSSAGYVLDPTAFPNAAALKADASLGRLNVLTTIGDTDGDGDFDQIYNIGGRGFSIFRDNGDGTVTKVRESGGEFEAILARDYASVFNVNQSLAASSLDTRSDDKGPEPEGVTIGAVGDRTYAFIALERVGGVMIYDITNPAAASFVGFTPATANDLGPETLVFIPAAQSPTGTALLATANEVSGTVTLYRVAVPQNGSLSIAPASGAEGNSGTGAITFTVSRSGGTDGAVSASYTVTNGNTDAADFGGTLPSGTVTFAAGASTATITIPVTGDTAFEPDETFTVTLSAPQGGATIAAASATGTITNDDAAPTLSIGNATVVEGDSGTTTLVYTVTSSAPAGAGGIGFSIATGGGTATAGTDYVAQATTGQIAAGQSSTTFSVVVNGDTTYEQAETVVVTISNPTNATITTAQGTGTITNDDPVPTSGRIFAENFTGFTAAGFAPTPGVGQLDSDVWRVVGLSDNTNPAYGFTAATGDFARGTIAGTADPLTAGVYSPSTNGALVVQPTGAEIDVGGFIEARIQNTSGLTATSFTVAFDWAFRNSGARSSNLQLSYSTDGTNFTVAPDTSFATPATADASIATSFTLTPEAATLTGLTVGDGGFLFLRWTHLNSSGGGNRDEVGIDNLTVDATLSTDGVFVINDVSAAEGNGGTTLVTLTVTRTSGTGAATIDFATANGTATAGSDYVAQSGTLSFADGETSRTITISVTGDLANEAAETLFVNFSNPVGATLPDAQARVTITNDDTGPVAIYDIQGAGHRSGFVGASVTTTGVVTAIDDNGFYIQDPTGDGNIATSDGIFVFTANRPALTVGNAVSVTGTVSEFTSTTAGSLSLTQITAPTIQVTAQSVALPAAVVISGNGTGDRTPPTANIDDDGLTSFDPVMDGLDFYESLEGMLVTVQTPLVVGNTNDFGETYVVASGGAGATGINSHSGITLGAGDNNPEKIQIDDDAGIFAGYTPGHTQGDLLGNVTGVLNYAFAEYELLVTAPVTVTTDVTQVRETTNLVGDAFNFTYASFNVENLAPVPDSTNPERDTQPEVDLAFTRHATEIVTALKSPDIIGLQEIQDADGAGAGANLSGAASAQKLIDAIVAAGGPRYTYVEVAPTVANSTGGQANGNIRNGYLYNDARVDYVAGSARLLEDPAYNGSRRPLLADFSFNGQVFTAANVHATSRGGSDPLFGATQPPVQAGESSRNAQAAALKAYIDGQLALDPAKKFVVNGDFNGFPYETAVQTLTGDGRIVDLYQTLAPAERYSYYFGGNYQAFDYVMVSSSLAANTSFDVVHYNAGFTDGLSATDHDQAVARIQLVAAASAGNDTVAGGTGTEIFNLSAGGSDTVSGGGGSDGFFFGAALDSGDRITAAAGGDDQVIVQGNYTGATAINLAGQVFTGVDTLAIQPGNDTRFGDTSGALYSYDVSIADANIANDATLIVNANRLRAGETLSFNGSAETGGAIWFYAGAGNDTLVGGGGADRFYGRAGSDTLTGNGGGDTFFYLAASESAAGSLDRITDFTAGDLINVAGIDAIAGSAGVNDTFTFIGAGAFTGAGQLRAVNTGGANWTVEADIDGDLVADLIISVTTTGGHALVAGDFIL
ncbi:Calx-beta domain-containing protein [Sphingomonas guangdongensis]|uniref:Calx-beta domain-containing protein n=1 Tax=Sphingomonas guangdongensis TaxID=1141890 RepID=A0A285R0S2_9SPHN|nr:choice-of-anchor I family protein [Sphingomonas guangdongensis]SOB87695.1 Calx-beta domain-containing protein [Sphingomonas guangdongensis]